LRAQTCLSENTLKRNIYLNKSHGKQKESFILTTDVTCSTFTKDKIYQRILKCTKNYETISIMSKNYLSAITTKTNLLKTGDSKQICTLINGIFGKGMFVLARFVKC